MRKILLAVFGLSLFFTSLVDAEFIWVEGEKPSKSTMNRHPWWYDQVKKDQLSGGDWISNFEVKKVGEAEYAVQATDAGIFEFWVRANPVASKLSYQLNEGGWIPIDLGPAAKEPTNIAIDKKLDLRFIAWIKVGNVELKRGANVVHFRMNSENSNHGGLDCFVFSKEPFTPRGILKPGEVSSVRPSTEKDWFAFDPSSDKFQANSAIDMRFLNEKQAGENGFIAVKDGHFIHSKSSKPVRFWAVNGVAGKSRDDLKHEARQLAKYGVNLVRLHGPMFDKRGEVEMANVLRAIEVVEVLKLEGIYTHFSIYFPLWFDPPADLDWLPGYDGKSHSFASLFFNKKFQEKYRGWWKALLTTPSLTTGKTLADDPAVFGTELVNEDSFFFWTFNESGIPDQQLREIEHQFGEWVTKKYGSFEKVFAAWQGQKIPRDVPSEGRIGFRPLWNIANERSARDKDTAQFLAETQRRFYDESIEFLRGIGFKGMINASNWYTASPEVLGPIEKFTYTGGDFIDRHGYFGCQNGGEGAEWSILDGHTYVDRSALRFESEDVSKPATFLHPVMDPHYDNKPSMISETTWCRPNRHRGEAPLFLATYGALQDSDAIVHFAKDGFDWSVKPGYYMQPWTLTAPTQLGQFPAAALIFRRGLVQPGEIMAKNVLAVDELMKLQGTPLPQDAAFDELRLKDVPTGTTVKQGQRIDPLVHFVGRTEVSFPKAVQKSGQNATTLKPLAQFIDHKAKTVASSTKQLKLDWGRGILTINAPSAQGASGNLSDAGDIRLTDIAISVPRDVAHVVVVALDEKPIATSKRMLLQIMTEEKATDFRSEPVEGRRKKIESIGESPWLVRKIEGLIKLNRNDAAKLKVTPLDHFGELAPESVSSADSIRLLPDVMYYLIHSD